MKFFVYISTTSLLQFDVSDFFIQKNIKRGICYALNEKKPYLHMIVHAAISR